MKTSASTRREFLETLGKGGLAISVSSFLSCRKPVKRKPNVLLILTDDQGTLDVNCYGAKDLYTPNMDHLAETGIRFTQAYAHTVCCPSRAMLLTGRHPQRSNVNSWTQGNARSEQKGINMFKSEITIAETLKSANYKTGLFGKWHLGAHLDYGPTEQGFDEFLGIRDGFIGNYSHYFLHGKGFHDLYEGKKEIFLDGEYFPDIVTDRALGFIEKNKNKPFFLYLALNIPHYPEQSDKKYEERYKELTEPRRSYAKMISTTDDRIGRVVDKIEKLGLREDTIIIMMSDNGHDSGRAQIEIDNHPSGLPKGTEIGANGGGGYTGKWRGAKGDFLEGGIRLPAIISYPKTLSQGAVRAQAITAADWYPTIMELCGVPMPDVKLDGQSLLPIIRSANTPTHHKIMVWQFEENWTVREGDWKLIVNGRDRTDPWQGRPMRKGKARALDPVFLGNLADDEPEFINHAEEFPEIVERLTNLYKIWAQEVFPKNSGRNSF